MYLINVGHVVLVTGKGRRHISPLRSIVVAIYSNATFLGQATRLMSLTVHNCAPNSVTCFVECVLTVKGCHFTRSGQHRYAKRIFGRALEIVNRPARRRRVV